MPAFRRPPRLRQVAEAYEVTLPAPPIAPKPQRRPPMTRQLMMTMLPAIVMVSAMGGIAFATNQPASTALLTSGMAGSMALMGGMTAMMTRRDEDARLADEQREHDELMEMYEEALMEETSRAEQQMQREAFIATASFPAPSDLLRYAISLSPTIWERRPDDDDFLELRTGSGRRKSLIKLSSNNTTRDAAQQEIIDRLTWHEAAPVTVHLPAGTQAGMYGADELVSTSLAWLILQAAAWHAPWDLNIVVLSRDEDLCSWVKWLPHCGLKSKGTFQPLVARTGTEAGEALRAVANDVNSRSDGSGGVTYLIVADGRGWPSLSQRLERWLGSAASKASVLSVQNRFEDLSGDSEFVINLSAQPGRIQRRKEESEAPTFTPDGVWPSDAVRAAMALASIEVAVEERHTPIPSSARLGDILGASAGSAEAIEEAWRQSRQRFRLAAPIGIGADDSIVEIDLRRDGPHGLMAGTTGSGKSEFLQSLVVSLAARIPPDLLNFVLIDYKGGSAFRDVAELPHVVGVVTDLDERLAHRALTSLRAEMKRRETLFSSVQPAANNIIEYQSAPRRVPLANLIIIIDEFHRLVAEQPDFIDEMVQIAQLGRSLGIHLLLATQKPSGVITDHIRANTNLRICLRVTDEADSRDVLGGPEAAHIPRDLPGRVYIRVGNESLHVCQAGRVSGMVAPRLRTRRGVEVKTFLPPLAPPNFRRSGLLVRALNASTPDVEDEGEAAELVDERALLIEAIRGAATLAGFPEHEPPWQPTLPEQLDLGEIEGPRGVAATDGSIVIGLLDEPELQKQGPYAVNLDAGHIVVAGSSNAGKTVALLTIAAAAAKTWSPQRLHIYGIDYAGGGLLPLEDLPHCGGIALQHDAPRVQWLLQALRDFVGERLRQLSGTGSNGQGFPRILVLVDNFAGFYQAMQGSDEGQGTADDLAEIMDLGRSVGVTFVISVERPEALRAAVVALLQTRLLLDLTDPTGYAVFGVSGARRTTAAIPGRALLPGRFVHELQIATPDATLEMLKRSRMAAEGGPLHIAPLSNEVPYAPLVKQAALGGAIPGLLMGLAEGTRPIFMHPDGAHLLVLGPRRSGRSNALAIACIESQRLRPTRHFIMNPRRSPALRAVASAAGNDPAFVYAERLPDIEALLVRVTEEAASRQREYVAGTETFAPWAIVIDDIDAMELPPTANDALQQLALRGADVGATLFISGDTQALRSSYPSGVTRTLLNQRTGILLAPSTPDDFDFFGVRGKPSRQPPGRGYYCTAGMKHAVQVALLEEAAVPTA